MWLLNDDERKGLLVAVITGGRPLLRQRPTAKFLKDLHAFVPKENIIWIAREDDAEKYERDEHEIVTYTQEWAFAYASEHWMLTKKPERGGFYGAFVGREAACLEAEKRGCWGVLQLDDNITQIGLNGSRKADTEIIKRHGGLAFITDLLGATARTTNSRMTGAQLTAVNNVETKVARTGFPYSLFIETVGEGREHWYGPYEDDITHALQYGDQPSTTATIVPSLRYKKESKSKSGMRAHYNHERAVQLQRIFPERAHLTITRRANGMGDKRVFHKLAAGAVRNPLVIHHRERFQKIRERLTEVTRDWAQLSRKFNREKVTDRLEKQGITPTR